MYGIKAVLTLGLLLTAVESRPEGYGGVKGGRNHKTTANAFATAQAAAHADGGYPGVAQSFASATANAFAGDGTSNAAATANAYADGGNIGKVTGSDDANRNANPLGDSDDLRLSSQHSKDSETQSDNYEDGTSIRGHHIANTGTYGNSGSTGVNKPGQDRRPGCGVPAGVKGHRGVSGCTDNEENKPSVSNPFPTYNGHPELPADSKYPTSLDGGYKGNDAAAQPCASGASGCPKNKPSVSNPYPTYNENPDLSVGSKYPTSLDSGYDGNNAKPELPTCSSGTSGCSGNKPSVSNPHAAYPGYVDSSPDSQHAVDINHEQVEDHSGKPQDTPCFPGDPRCLAGSKPKPTTPDPSAIGIIDSGPIPCTPGSIDCPKTKPGAVNSYPTHQENPDLFGSSKLPMAPNGGYEGKTPTAGENPNSSQYPGSSRHAETSNPFLNGEIDVSGIKDSVNGAGSDIKTNPSNPFLYPHSQVLPPTCTKHPGKPNGSYGGSPTAPGYPHQGSSGDSTFPTIKPNPSNPFLPHNGNVNPPNDVQHPGVSSGSAQGHPATNGSCQGSACASNEPGHPPNSSEYPVNKPNPSNPFLSHNGNADSTNGAKHPGVSSGIPQNTNSPGTQGHSATNGGCHGSSSCTSSESGHPPSSSEYPVNKPNPSNPFLSHNGNGDSPSGVKHPGVSSSIPQNTYSPGTQGHPTTNGGCHGSSSCTSSEPGHPPSSSEYPVNKPNPLNPFLSHNGNGDSPSGVKHPGVSSGIPQNTNSPGTQGHSATNGGCHGSSSCTSSEPGHPPSSSEYPVNKPNPSNPFLSHNGNVDSTNGVKHPGVSSGIPQNTNSPGAQGHPATNDDCHGSTSCASNGPGHLPSSSEYPVNKPNPSNPFLSHNGNVDSPNGVKHPGVSSGIPQNTNSPSDQRPPSKSSGCHGSTSCGSNESEHSPSSSEYPVNKLDHSYPLLPHNGEAEKTTGLKYPNLKPPILKNPGSFGEGSYDRIDPHRNVNNNYGSQDVPSSYPGNGPTSPKPFLGDGQLTYPHLPHSGEAEKTTGLKYPNLKPPVLKNPGTFGEESYDRINPHRNINNNYGSQDVPSSYPGNGPTSPKPFLGDGQLTYPHLPHSGEAEKTTGLKYPNLKPPVLKNPGTFGEESYDRIDPHRNINNNYGSQDVPSSYPGNGPTGPNPFLGDGQLTNPHSNHGSHETPNSPKSLPGHNTGEPSSTEDKSEGIDGFHVNGHPYGTENYGVKTHRPGVKGGSRRREPPAKLQESSELGETELLSGNTGSAYSTAHASASASAYSSAHASSSSNSGVGHSSAKSEAYSDLGSSGSSNSWASSSASASAGASAFASSGSHQDSENWQFPDVTSQ